MNISMWIRLYTTRTDICLARCISLVYVCIHRMLIWAYGHLDRPDDPLTAEPQAGGTQCLTRRWHL